MSATPAFAPSTVPPQRANDLHLRTILEQLPVALMRLDDAGMLLAVNDAGLALLGADSLDRVLNTSFLSFLPDEVARADCAGFIHDAAHGLRGSRELRMRNVSGDEHVVEAQAIAYPGALDQTPSVTVTLRDVSRTHALTQSLIEASERHAQVEHAHATERERWSADRSAVEAALGRSQNLERERDEARTALADREARHADLERAHEAERAAAQQEATQLRAALDAAHTAARDADVALASARAAADEARAALSVTDAALSTTEASLAQQRAQADADIAAARDEARRAREAWSDHEAVRRAAEQRRQLVEDAVARLAVEIGLVSREHGTGDNAGAGGDGEARSAW